MDEIVHDGIRLRALDVWPDYWAGEDGHIYSSKRGKWRKYHDIHRLKETSIRKNQPYRTVSLYRASDTYERRNPDGTTRIAVRPHNQAVHRLVASVWLPDRPSPEHEIDHQDEDRNNNRPDNLRWLTKQQNTGAYLMNHPHAQVGSNNPSAKITEKDVPVIRALQGMVPAWRVGEWFGVSDFPIYGI